MLIRRSGHDEDSGFTIIELLISVSIMGLIIASLVSTMFVAMNQNKTTDVRLSESSDLQVAAAPLSADVSGALTFATATAPTCGTAAYNNAGFMVLEMVGKTFDPTAALPLTPAGTSALPSTVVTYVKKRVTVNSKDAYELRRLTCTASGQAVADTDRVIGRMLSYSTPPSVQCFTSIAPTTAAACTSAGVVTVKLTLTPQSADASLSAVLIAHRRTS